MYALSHRGEDRTPGNVDYAEERGDAFENGKAFNLVDKKRVEEKNYGNALTTSASNNAFEENSIRSKLSPAISLSSVNDAENGKANGRHRYSCDEDVLRDDGTDRIRSCGVKCDYDRNPPVPLRTSERVFLMEAQCTRSAALVARKIDLETLSSDCLARNSNECVSNTLGYRLPYGLSSLEISSKYLSNRNELLSRNNSGYPASYASDGPFTRRTSTAAAFFAR